MLEVLQFVFSSFWVFLGTLVLLAITLQAGVALIIGLAAIIRGGNINIST